LAHKELLAALFAASSGACEALPAHKIKGFSQAIWATQRPRSQGCSASLSRRPRHVAKRAFRISPVQGFFLDGSPGLSGDAPAAPPGAGSQAKRESALQSELRSLGHPRAALVAAPPSSVAQNSTYQLVNHVKLGVGTLEAMIEPATWDTLDEEKAGAVATRLARIAALRELLQGPKPKNDPGYAPRAEVSKHVATARVLAEKRVVKRP
jgi:hypothetical protein